MVVMLPTALVDWKCLSLWVTTAVTLRCDDRRTAWEATCSRSYLSVRQDGCPTPRAVLQEVKQEFDHLY